MLSNQDTKIHKNLEFIENDHALASLLRLSSRNKHAQNPRNQTSRVEMSSTQVRFTLVAVSDKTSIYILLLAQPI